MSNFGDWKFTADRSATISAYSQAVSGGVDKCDCAGCRNFRVARVQVFPESFLLLLDQLGVDPLKDADVFHSARLSSGRHGYGGWYHFIGTLDATGDFPAVQLADGFVAWMCIASAPTLASLENLPTVQLEFYAEHVPWLLSEPEPT